jgi:uncharacterized membrane protein (DUF4010 family)
MATFVVTTASAVALVRILIEIFVIVPAELSSMALPILFNFLVMSGLCLWLFLKFSREEDAADLPEPQNPAQFKTALIFGLLYGIILLLVAVAEEYFGHEGLYAVAFISGITNVDAITLSVSQMISEGGIGTSLGWRLVLLASLSNLLFKGAIVAVLGKKKLLKWVSFSFGVAIVTGLLTIWLWPEEWHLNVLF